MGRQLKPMAMGAIFTLVAMGFAYALPHAVLLQPMSDEESGEVVGPELDCPADDESPDDGTGGEDQDVEVVDEEGEVVEGEGQEDIVEDEGEGGSVEDEGDEEECVEEEQDVTDEEDEGEVAGAKVDGDGNHGHVVRVAAHCDVKGRDHGELVQSIAQDKDATVDDAEAACKTAIADAEASGDRTGGGKPDKAKTTGKPDDAGKGKPSDGGSAGASRPSSEGSSSGNGNGKED